MLLHVNKASRLALLHFLSQHQHASYSGVMLIFRCCAGATQCSIYGMRLRRGALNVECGGRNSSKFSVPCEVMQCSLL